MNNTIALPEFMVMNEFREEKLKKCLSSYHLSESPLYAVYPERKFMLSKLKYFLEMLKNYLNNLKKTLVDGDFESILKRDKNEYY